jgi:hypothetical protein
MNTCLPLFQLIVLLVAGLSCLEVAAFFGCAHQLCWELGRLHCALHNGYNEHVLEIFKFSDRLYS